MTRKDYILIAAAIKEAQAHNPWTTEEARQAAALVRKTIAENMCGILRSDNPRFDCDRFLVAALGV